jgi:hypothetical protein
VEPTRLALDAGHPNKLALPQYFLIGHLMFLVALLCVYYSTDAADV